MVTFIIYDVVLKNIAFVATFWKNIWCFQERYRALKKQQITTSQNIGGAASMIKIIQDIFKANILSKFEDGWVKTVTARV